MRKEFASFAIAISSRRKSCSHVSWNFIPRTLWQKCTLRVRWNMSKTRLIKRGMQWKYSRRNETGGLAKAECVRHPELKTARDARRAVEYSSRACVIQEWR